MSFLGLEIKRSYDSYADDLVSDFFNPVFKEAKIYKRVAAYFSSSSFKAVSKGLASLLANGGKMELIISVITSHEDFEAIESGIKDKGEVIASMFDDESVVLEMLEDDSAKALYKLLVAGRLEMRFAISTTGLFHMKFGVIEDRDGNTVSFSGSLNETSEGFEVNGEEFKVFRSWVPGESKYVEIDSSKFNSYWEGRIPLQRAIISNLPTRAMEKIKAAAKKALHSSIVGRTLRPYQEQAVEFWTNSGYSAILEMATGTGKTITALASADRLYKERGKKFTIILAPTIGVAAQWKNAWKDVFKNIPLVYSPRNKKDFSMYCSTSGNDGVVVLTYTSMSKNVVPEHVFKENGSEILLIADEAHWLGAEKFSLIMGGNFRYRLGLSATPQRLLDDEGTEKILNFFGNKEFPYSLENAISGHYLSEYNYYPYFCRLSPEEVNEYAKLTKRAISSKGEKTKDETVNSQEMAIMLRARVPKKAAGKIPIFSSIVEDLVKSGKLHHTLVFLEDNGQLGKAKEELLERSVAFEVVDKGTVAIDRVRAMDRLDNGEVACILSMRSMDEGMDLPSAEREIIMSSSTNPRQYIQRAGRILRLSPNKKIAEIYDILVYANRADCPSWLWKYESQSIKNEIRRARYFIEASRNKSESRIKLISFGQKVNISIWD